MGIEASYIRLSPAEWRKLENIPNPQETFFGIDWDDDEAVDAWNAQRRQAGRLLDIGKNGDGLHFLLTGRSALMNIKTARDPLSVVVTGGTDTLFEASYGHVRALSLQEVLEVSRLLQNLNQEELRAAFWRNLPQAGDVYAFDGDEDELEILLDVFQQVRAFFDQAATEGDVVLLSSD